MNIEIRLLGIQLEDDSFKFKGHINIGEHSNERVSFSISREEAQDLIKMIIGACESIQCDKSKLNEAEKKALECAETFCKL